MDNQVRKKRVDSEGEWEYECVVCELWLPQQKFRGCKNYVDGFGNCLMCSSCRAKKAHEGVRKSEEEQVRIILTNIGFYDYPNPENWIKMMKIKHGIK